ADRVMVMYGGQIVEQAKTNELLKNTIHPYTHGLLKSLPQLEQDQERLETIEGTVPPADRFPDGCRFSTRCPYVMEICHQNNPDLTKVREDYFVRCHLYETEVNQMMNTVKHDVLVDVQHVKKYFPLKGGVLKRTVGYVKAVDDVSFHILRGETLGIDGESGSRKSTLGRVILRLLTPSEGKIFFNGKEISQLRRKKLRPFRRNMQMIFQDPFASLNSKMSVAELIEEPLLVQTSLTKSERKEKALEMMEKVGLRAEDQHKYPHEFSG